MVHRVASPDDPRLAPYRHIADTSWLRAEGLFVAEGRLVVERLLQLRRHAIASILVTEAAFAALQSRLARAETNVYVADAGLLNGLTGFNFHRGCLALAARPAPLPVDAVTRTRRLLGVEGIGNPDNIGGLFRAAAAFGVGGVLLDRTAGDPLYRKAIRTSMGAALTVPFARAEDWTDVLARLRRDDCRLIALTPDRNADPIDSAAQQMRKEPRWMVLAGAEGSGLSQETLALADARVRIPVDPAVDSLNVVVAAAIALHVLR